MPATPSPVGTEEHVPVASGSTPAASPPVPGAAESKPAPAGQDAGRPAKKPRVVDQTRNVAPGHEWHQTMLIKRKQTIEFQFSSETSYSVRLASVGPDRVQALIESSKTVKKDDIILDTKTKGDLQKTITVEPGAVEFRVKNLGRTAADVHLRTSTTEE
jgi:hypothetical protein